MFWLGAASQSGCIGGPLELYLPDNDGGGGSEGAFDAGKDDAPSDPGDDADTPDASVSPVLVAITPTPAAAGDAPTAAESLAADLATFGAGARASVVSIPWDALDGPATAALAKRTDLYADHAIRALVNLAVVDRAVDHRPAAIAAGAWSSTATLAAMRAAVDAIFGSSGDELSFLTFGRDVDVYLAAHPSERDAFIGFAKEACAYAKGHPGAPADLRVGVAFSPAAPKAETAFTALLDSEDVVAFSYFPGIDSFDSDASLGVAAAVADMADVGAAKPIVLQAAGVPSDPVAGGGDDAQATFFASLFGAIEAHRKSFALVNVVELNDAAPASCAAWAEAQGSEPGGPLAAYACSLGLRRADGAPKPAWSAVLAGSAALSSP